MKRQSNASSRPCSCFTLWRRCSTSVGDQEGSRSRVSLRPSERGHLEARDVAHSSSRVANASKDMYSRTSSAMNSKKFSTNSGRPREALAQTRILRGDADRKGVEVHTRIMTQPDTTSGAVAKPNSSRRASRDDDVTARLELSVQPARRRD